MRDLRHENLVPFIGACVETGHIAILTQLCARGNLHHVLNNSDYRLDNMFIASLVGDLIRGMIYLHESEIVFHGNLKPTNCLVDSRWVLQISDFGLRYFKGNIKPFFSAKTVQLSILAPKKKKITICLKCTILAGEDLRYGLNQYELLWKAPEFLRTSKKSPPAPAPSLASITNALSTESVAVPMSSLGVSVVSAGSQKGDVYSFALILYEIMGRQGPWGKSLVSSREVSCEHLNGH